MNPKRKTPASPAVYRPQPVPRVLQTKTNRGTGHGFSNPAASSRTLQPAGLNRHRLSVAVVRSPVIQRMEQPPAPQPPQPAAGAGRSGRSAGDLWDTFCRYPYKQQRDDIEKAFRDAGYTILNMRAAILKAITALKLDLAAHGSGGQGDGVQGDLEAEVKEWVDKLSGWAAAYPAGVRAAPSGQRDSPQQQAARQEQKLEQKAKKARQKKLNAVAACKAAGSHILGKSGSCSKCGGK